MNPIDRIRGLMDARPEWAHLYALELDCQLLRDGAADLLTLSRHGTVSTSSAAVVHDEAVDGDVVREAARLLATGQRGRAMRWLHGQARGPAIHAANLVFANAAGDADDVWLHFTNKYLRRYGVGTLALREGPQPRYLRLHAPTAQRRVDDGPLVSVLMPARNVVPLVGHACRSLLQQSWARLEVIVVDDASDDDTWACLEALAHDDARVRPLRLARPVGPYVAKNIALAAARGAYVTTHDADDWALPDRIERQLRPLLADPALKLSTGRMLRMSADGQFTRFAAIGPLSHDGALRRCYVSPLIERAFFDRHLGAWDSVRFGADSELLGRIERFAAGRLVELVQPVMLALDAPAGLTRQAGSAIADTGALSEARQAYQQRWQAWHAAQARLPRLDFPLVERPFEAPAEMGVPVELQRQPAEPAAAVAPTTPVQRDILVQTELRLRDAPDAEAVLQEAAALAGEQERPAIALLRANLALGSDEAWLRHVNAYLTQFGLEPLQLAEGPGERFWRIRAATPRQVDDGPLVTVIMPAFNAGDSLEFAARSVLDQTWRRLELVIVDDASDDRTAEIAKAIARADDRVTVLHNRANVGPYVSKNFGLRVARGQFITGHDADDWAHPERIERQVRHMLQAGPALKAHLMGMLRCEATGLFSRLSRVTNNSRDGGLQAAFISAFFDARFLHETVGHWDEARFAGDSELIGRVERILGAPVERVHCMGMVCLDSPAGLTNHPEHGYSPERGLSESRHLYREAFRRWHRTLDAHSGRLDFPQKVRRFPIPDAVRVDPDALARCVQGHAALPSRAPMPTA